MTMKILGVLLGALLLAGQATAVELTKGEEGRAVVSQCYAQCALKVTELDAEYADINIALLMQYSDLVSGSARLGIDPARFDNVFENLNHTRCALDQGAMNITNLCDAGCRDLEHVYGSVASWAKTRFRYFYNEAKDDLQESGLWTDYRNWPRRGEDVSEFELACDRYLGK